MQPDATLVILHKTALQACQEADRGCETKSSYVQPILRGRQPASKCQQNLCILRIWMNLLMMRTKLWVKILCYAISCYIFLFFLSEHFSSREDRNWNWAIIELTCNDDIDVAYQNNMSIMQVRYCYTVVTVHHMLVYVGLCAIFITWRSMYHFYIISHSFRCHSDGWVTHLASMWIQPNSTSRLKRPELGTIII